MPIYMDLHEAPGVTALGVAEAHTLDLLIQHEHNCNLLTYWIDEKRGNVFCLVEAERKEDVVEMHRRAHGMIPNKIIEVDESLVQAFLGRIADPADATIAANGLKVFHDPSFRVLLITRMDDPVLLQSKIGVQPARELVTRLNDIVREALTKFDGAEAEQGGEGIVASFVSAGSAIKCAQAIKSAITNENIHLPGFRMAISAGEPVEKGGKLFEDAIRRARNMMSVAGPTQVAVSVTVKDLVQKDLASSPQEMTTLSAADEALVEALMATLEEKSAEAEFNVADYCEAMAMSKSQLYRKIVAIFGCTPNDLLKEYRLEKARQLLRKNQHNISQVTFDTGFTSPSYFTKCFKKRYGLLPMAYLEMHR